MKIIRSFKILSLMLVTAFLPALPGCGSDDEDSRPLCERLMGNWVATSYVEDGDELLGNGIKELKMKYEGTGCEGQVNWDISFGAGPFAKLSGDYSVDEGGKKVTMKYVDNNSYTFDLKIENDNLEISGVAAGFNTAIKAKRQ